MATVVFPYVFNIPGLVNTKVYPKSLDISGLAWLGEDPVEKKLDNPDQVQPMPKAENN